VLLILRHVELDDCEHVLFCDRTKVDNRIPGDVGVSHRAILVDGTGGSADWLSISNPSTIRRVPFRSGHLMKTLVVLSALAIALTACGETADGEPSEPSVTTTTVAAATSAAPTTTAAPATTTTEASSGIIPGSDVDVDAIVVAYSVAFDSTSDYLAKEPYIDDPTGLEETVGKYLSTGETMGGISVLVTDVVVAGEEADVTYDLLFNNNPTYPDLPGTAVLTADGWKVPRQVFCALMSSARVGCPAE
jgi:iron complex transport system substrate-binding protein